MTRFGSMIAGLSLIAVFVGSILMAFYTMDWGYLTGAVVSAAVLGWST